MEDELTFGQYLKLLIKQKGFTKAEFQRQIKLSKTYLLDIEHGDVYPPPKLQVRMMALLQLGQAEKAAFFDKASAGRGELPTDVFLYLQANKEKIQELREEFYGTIPR